MTSTSKLLISVLALFFAAQVHATPILVGEFNSDDASEKVAVRSAIDTYNGTHTPGLSQLFGAGANPDLINEWVAYVPKTSDVSAYNGATGHILHFIAPGTFLEYYVFSRYGSGGADFNSALHHLMAGDELTYNPGGDAAPRGLSDIAIWARPGSTNVPDSGVTIALFGVSLMLLGIMKRRMSS